MASLTDLIVAHPVACARLSLLTAFSLSGVLTACLTDAQLRAAVLGALSKAGWTIQAAAAQIGISRQRLGHQLDGSDPLTCLSRLAPLDGFWTALIEQTATCAGVVVIQHTDLADILTHLKGNKPMQRMTLIAHAAKESA